MLLQDHRHIIVTVKELVKTGQVVKDIWRPFGKENAKIVCSLHLEDVGIPTTGIFTMKITHGTSQQKWQNYNKWNHGVGMLLTQLV